MIVLDANVLSELTKPAPAEMVLDWFKMQPRPSLFITSVTQAEMLLEIELLPKGKRRSAIQLALEGLFDDFAGRILSFDSEAAHQYAVIAACLRALGRPFKIGDAQTAGIVRANGAILATRDTGDFEHCGITVLNPWTFSPGKVRR
jgi:predicted nucleic acid-binding protein